MKNRLKTLALTSCAIIALATAAHAQDKAKFDIAGGDLKTALQTFATQTSQEVLFSTDIVAGRKTKGLNAETDPQSALVALLDGTGLTFQRTPTGTLLVVRASNPQSGSAAGDGADGTVAALIVTAQKREEDIQDVPIAISAFTQEDLTRSQVAGGPDLITQVPNMTFTKTNFSSYSVQIRGIGTQAISATTDPAVAVAFNNTPFIRNRFFEQEFYDLQRVEVLRGPQGTLYGRNATGGVVNLISQKPKFIYEAKLSVDVGNFSSSRLEGMVNIPLVEDKAALRVAGAWTKRDGYAANQLTGNPIDGRDLWSTRVSLRVQPTDRINANLIWEHFQENDDRLRSGKQLCTKDVVTNVAGFPVGYFDTLPNTGQINLFSGVQATFSQGCTRGSLYSSDTYQTPNGLMLPYYLPLGGIGLPVALQDPYLSTVQSPNLRLIESTIDPKYSAHSDIGELQLSFDVTDALTLTSETAYGADTVYSLQDFNRFDTAPGAWQQPEVFNPERGGVLSHGPNGGIFCDPQLGCSDRLVAVDISTAKARQFSQELRLASDFDGAFNFSLGANYLRADSEDKYYVFINSLSIIAALGTSFNMWPDYVSNVSDNSFCLRNGYLPGDVNGTYPVQGCVYIDPNQIDSVNDEGHNYFLSKNPYKLISYAVFGEAYYKISDTLKVTAGLRWTVDKKDAPRIPTWLLATQSVGYPIAEVIQQEWREPTGRLAIDWKPNLSFTDQTMVYASYAHGYKAGGANPPGFVRVFYADKSVADANSATSATRPLTFAPEFVDALELGTKNTLADGKVTLNLASFYYDYKGYQISEIVDRSAFNRNFDATVWGVELESEWRPMENLRLGFKGGYEKTSIANGQSAVDLMDRTAGDPNWTLVRPFPTYASSCILPTWLFVGSNWWAPPTPTLVGLGGVGGGNAGGCELAYVQGLDPVTHQTYVANPSASAMDYMHYAGIDYTAWSTNLADYPGLTSVPTTQYPGWDPSTAPNHGEGIAKPVGGNELPNAPHWTATVTGDYTLSLASDWLMTLHTDVHWQSQSWWRVFNDSTFDKLHPYFTMNLAAIFTNEERGWNIMAYVKNVTDETAITGAFLNSDDTGLTTNVFLTEPRLYGLRVTKQWTGASGGWVSPHEGPNPYTVEVGGQLQRHNAPNGYLDPQYADTFRGPVAIFQSAQEHKLDWGQGGELRFAWRPAADTVSVSADWRFGETNGFAKPTADEEVGPICGYTDSFEANCTLFANNPFFGRLTNLSGTNYAQASVWDQEHHEIGELAIGKDVDFAGLRHSRLSAGLRYAKLESATKAELRGVPDWDLTPGFYQPLGIPISRTVYKIDVAANRQFKGFGPSLAWDASLLLLGEKNAGTVNLDWSVGAGVLFGTQKATITGTQAASYLQQTGFQIAFADFLPPTLPTETAGPAVDIRRSDHATVPNADVSLGLSYEVRGFKMGAGYRWERYFNAIDGGYEEHKSYDRTLDGPYFKIAVGFGG